MVNQDPAALSISTDIRPISLKFPETFSKPGSVFNLRVPRTKSDEGSVQVDTNEHFREITDQAEYPIAHFGNLNTIFIETGKLDVSGKLARELITQPWMQG